MITVNYLLERVENGLMDEIRWAEDRGFKRDPDGTPLGDPQWDNGDVRLVLGSDLQWVAATSFGSMTGDTPKEAITRCRDWIDRKLKSTDTLQKLKDCVDCILDDSIDPAADSVTLRAYRGRHIPYDCYEKIKELEREGWKALPDVLGDRLAWARSTVLKTLRLVEGSGWVWGTHENPFSEENTK